MSLKDTLKEDLKTAMKAGDAETRSVVGLVLSAAKNRELEKRGKLAKGGTPDAELDTASQLTDEEVMDVILSEVKKRKESIAQFEAGGRPELAADEQRELGILQKYLPEQLSSEALDAEIAASIKELNPQGVKDMGKVIGHVMAKVKGRADGNDVSVRIKAALS